MNEKNEMKFDSNYGNDTNRLVVEQYKLYMEMLDRSTKRRMDTNALFISINALMVTLTALYNKGNLLAFYPVSVTGFLLSCLWYLLLRNYNVVNREKWEVLYEMEALLPCNPFEKEWTKHRLLWIPKATTATNQHKKPYFSISLLERAFPALFALMYIVLGMWAYKPASEAVEGGELSASIVEVQETVADLKSALYLDAENSELNASIAEVKEIVADLQSSLNAENHELSASISDVKGIVADMKPSFGVDFNMDKPSFGVDFDMDTENSEVNTSIEAIVKLQNALSVMESALADLVPAAFGGYSVQEG